MSKYYYSRGGQRQGVNADQLRESKALEKHTSRDAPQTLRAFIPTTIQAEFAYALKENARAAAYRI
jgi:hypothetical protein